VVSDRGNGKMAYAGFAKPLPIDHTLPAGTRVTLRLPPPMRLGEQRQGPPAATRATRTMLVRPHFL
jgi:hypothetical protein